MFLTKLIGQRLCAVTFVEDYLQLQFDDYGLNVYNPASINREGQRRRSGELGFCDALVSMINRRISEVEFRESDSAILRFDDAATVCVSVAPDDYSGPEALELRSNDRSSPTVIL